jgi:hypothetical protein
MANNKKDTEMGIEKSFLLLKEKANSSLTVAEVLHILSGRGYPLLLTLFSLPFCQPIQIPGFSTPFGILISFIGLRIAFGHHSWLPKFILNKTLSKEAIHKISQKGLWLTKKLTRFTSVRWEFMSREPFFHMINGIVISLLGIVLALPLPIPLSNIVVAWAILLISMGLFEDDGLFILLGYAIGVFSILILIGFIYAIF